MALSPAPGQLNTAVKKLFGLFIIASLWLAGVQSAVRASKKLTDFDKATGLLQSVEINRNRGRSMPYHVEVRLWKNPTIFGIVMNSDESYKMAQNLKKKLVLNTINTIYFEPIEATVNGVNFNVYQIDNNGKTVFALAETSSSELKQAVLCFFFAAFGSIAAWMRWR